MKLRLLALLVIPLWLWSAPSMTDEAQWERHMLAGMAAVQRGGYETAVQETERALALKRGRTYFSDLRGLPRPKK